MNKALAFYIISKPHMNRAHAKPLSWGAITPQSLSAPYLLLGFLLMTELLCQRQSFPCVLPFSRFQLKRFRLLRQKILMNALMSAQIRRTEPYPGVFKRVHSSTIETSMILAPYLLLGRDQPPPL
jgi:hypothetical protein